MTRVWLSGVAVLLVVTAPAAEAAPQRPLFQIVDPRIDEASGIAPGLASPGVAYVQNDSGDDPRFFALDARTGATAAVVTVDGATNIDWEDLAVARDAAGRPSVWLADIGDNDAVRAEVRVYRVDEPAVHPSARGRRIHTRAADVWRLRYPHGPVDAESFAVTPHGIGYVITKSVRGDSVVYRLPRHADSNRVQTLRRVGAITFAGTSTQNPFGDIGTRTATGAAISPSGSMLAVRTYADAYVWQLRSGDVAAALRSPPRRVALPEQRQGEGIAFAGRNLLVDSEGPRSPVYAVALPVPGGSPRRTASASRSAAPADDSSRWVVSGVVAAGAVVAGVTGVLWSRRRRRRQ